ncbi:hypothetical protein [Rheinheimera sp.]|uniref:hypothetical protein n=1 Tax=Rheinheimera sp. TaxID=1869214 RepID=UPI0027BB02B7|nr:hypothetical protein [Rheinheimera sp.]
MIFRGLILTLMLLLGGCASSSMVKAPNQQLAAVPADKAQIVFMRSSIFGAAISAPMFDVTAAEPAFIGILDNSSKLMLEVPAGKHTFMVVSEAADFLEADLVAGKRYYAIVTPRMGAWKARFSIWPVRADNSGEFNKADAKVQKIISNTVLMQNSAKSEAWYQKNKNDVKNKQAEYWPVWQQKPTAELLERTLLPTDGE